MEWRERSSLMVIDIFMEHDSGIKYNITKEYNIYIIKIFWQIQWKFHSKQNPYSWVINNKLCSETFYLSFFPVILPKLPSTT